MIEAKHFRMEHIKERIRHHFHEVMKTKRSEHSIALGFAIGTLISILPTPGFNVLLALIIVLIFEKVNKFSLFGSLAFWNPITLLPVYSLSYSLGDRIFASEPVARFNTLLLNQIFDFSKRFLLGNLILAITISIISYLVVYGIVVLFRRYRKRKDAAQDAGSGDDDVDRQPDSSAK